MAIEKKDDARVVTGRSDRLAAIDAITSNIEKQFGKGAIMRLGEGTGAALAAGIVKAAALCHSGMATFGEAGVSDK